MKNKKVTFFLAVVIVISLVVSSVVVLKPFEKILKVACYTISSQGLGQLSNNQETIAQTIRPSDSAVVNISKQHPISEVIAKKVVGNIIQKTVSPYSANTSFSNVYINNKIKTSVDIKNGLTESLGYKIEKNSSPQILIYHTHTTESYLLEDKSAYTEEDNTRTTDNTKNVVAIGEQIVEQLRNAGYEVIHDKTLHDYPGYTGSYTRSAETVKSILNKYPSIKIAIDVHRDSIASGNNDKIAPTILVDGKEAAQVMLVMGSQTGSVSGYPNWRENLKLAMKLQFVFESTYPSFARPILLKSAKYNQNLTTGSILLEMGSDANTLEQALYSGQLVGKSLVTLFDSQGW